MPRTVTKTLAIAAATFIMASAGCGSTSPSGPVAVLEGGVTIDGNPLPADAEGSLVFMSQANRQAPPTQALLTAGHYKAEKVPVGKVLVQFHILKPTGKTLKTSPDDIHPVIERIDLVPASMQAGLPIDVSGDNPAQNFDLR